MRNIKLETRILKRVITKARKVKPNHILEISNFYELAFNDEGLKLTATDGANYLEVKTDKVIVEKPAIVIVRADQLYKLVNNISAKEISLTATDEYLEVREVGAGGVYKVDIRTDEEYPTISMNSDTILEVNTETLKHAFKCTKRCKSKSTHDGSLFYYLIRNEKLITSYYLKRAFADLPGFTDEVLISPNMANMISTLDSKITRVEIDKDNQKIKFIGDNVVIIGAIMEGANKYEYYMMGARAFIYYEDYEDYPKIQSIIEENFPYICTIDKDVMIGAINRIKPFIDLDDEYGIKLIFKSDELVISTYEGSYEKITYEDKSATITKDITLEIRANFLLDILKSISTSIVTISTEDGIMKFESNNDVYTLAGVDYE